MTPDVITLTLGEWTRAYVRGDEVSFSPETLTQAVRTGAADNRSLVYLGVREGKRCFLDMKTERVSA